MGRNSLSHAHVLMQVLFFRNCIAERKLLTETADPEWPHNVHHIFLRSSQLLLAEPAPDP